MYRFAHELVHFSLEHDRHAPAVLQRLELLNQTETYFGPFGKPPNGERIVIAFTRKHTQAVSVGAQEVRLGSKSGRDLLASFRKIMPEGTSFLSTFIRLATKMQSYLITASYLPTSQASARVTWLSRLIALAAEADAVDSTVFANRTAEGPTAALLAYEQACNMWFFAGPNGPNRLAWAECDSAAVPRDFLEKAQYLIGSFRANKAFLSSADSLSRSSTSSDPVAAARIERLERDLQALKRKAPAPERKAPDKAKKAKGEPSLKVTLFHNHRCDQYDREGKCDNEDACPAFIRKKEAHSCSMCLATDHWLNGPTGRCTKQHTGPYPA
jgi:hypothetical protein